MKTTEENIALGRLNDILLELDELGEEARNIIQDTFPHGGHINRAEAYAVCNFGFSNNPYDTTLASIIKDIENDF